MWQLTLTDCAIWLCGLGTLYILQLRQNMQHVSEHFVRNYKKQHGAWSRFVVVYFLPKLKITFTFQRHRHFIAVVIRVTLFVNANVYF